MLNDGRIPNNASKFTLNNIWPLFGPKAVGLQSLPSLTCQRGQSHRHAARVPVGWQSVTVSPYRSLGHGSAGGSSHFRTPPPSRAPGVLRQVPDIPGWGGGGLPLSARAPSSVMSASCGPAHPSQLCGLPRGGIFACDSELLLHPNHAIFLSLRRGVCVCGWVSVILTTLSGFSRITEKRRGSAPPFFAFLFETYFLHPSWKFQPKVISDHATRPVQWFYLHWTPPAIGHGFSFKGSTWNFQELISASVHTKCISWKLDFGNRSGTFCNLPIRR